MFNRVWRQSPKIVKMSQPVAVVKQLRGKARDQSIFLLLSWTFQSKHQDISNVPVRLRQNSSARSRHPNFQVVKCFDLKLPPKWHYFSKIPQRKYVQERHSQCWHCDYLSNHCKAPVIVPFWIICDPLSKYTKKMANSVLSCQKSNLLFKSGSTSSWHAKCNHSLILLQHSDYP